MGTGVPGYIVNCNKAMSTGPMMFGSIEAVSRQALERYFADPGKCSFGYQFGEDRWFGNCLASLGAQGIQDFGMVGDGECTGKTFSTLCSANSLCLPLLLAATLSSAAAAL